MYFFPTRAHASGRKEKFSDAHARVGKNTSTQAGMVFLGVIFWEDKE
jgi:hypothetical protein